MILLIGKVPQRSVFDGIIKQINDKTDIKVSYDVEGVKKKKYKFKINHKVNLKSSEKSKAKTKTKTKKSINVDVMEKSKQQLQQMKNKGQKIVNEEGYLKTIYDNEIERLNPKEVVKSDSDTELERWIKVTVDKLKKDGSVNYVHNNYLVLKAKNAQIDRIEKFLILDDYKIYNRMDWQRISPMTTDSESTMDFINEYEIEEDVFSSFGQTIRNATHIQIKR